MPKSAHNDVMDGMLEIIAAATSMIACSAQPTTHAEATATYALADVAMVAGDGNDFTIADGDTSGRKVTMAAKAGVAVDATGDANHIALVDGTRLLYVTTCTTQTLTQGNTVDFPAWKVEVADPA